VNPSTDRILDLAVAESFLSIIAQGAPVCFQTFDDNKKRLFVKSCGWILTQNEGEGPVDSGFVHICRRSLDGGFGRRVLFTSTKRRRLLDAYRFPGFRAIEEVRGVFGDPHARASSRLFGAQKNDLRGVRTRTFRVVRSQASPGSSRTRGRAPAPGRHGGRVANHPLTAPMARWHVAPVLPTDDGAIRGSRRGGTTLAADRSRAA
jgi:hypothetical protein